MIIYFSKVTEEPKLTEEFDIAIKVYQTGLSDLSANSYAYWWRLDSLVDESC